MFLNTSRLMASTGIAATFPLLDMQGFAIVARAGLRQWVGYTAPRNLSRMEQALARYRRAAAIALTPPLVAMVLAFATAELAEWRKSRRLAPSPPTNHTLDVITDAVKDWLSHSRCCRIDSGSSSVAASWIGATRKSFGPTVSRPRCHIPRDLAPVCGRQLRTHFRDGGDAQHVASAYRVPGWIWQHPAGESGF